MTSTDTNAEGGRLRRDHFTDFDLDSAEFTEN
jgi:hypothetical protein